MRPPTSPPPLPRSSSDDTRWLGSNSVGPANPRSNEQPSVAAAHFDERFVDEIRTALTVADQAAEQRIAFVATGRHPISVCAVGHQLETRETVAERDRDLVVFLTKLSLPNVMAVADRSVTSGAGNCSPLAAMVWVCRW